VSADHASAVIDTFPGAAYSSEKWWVIDIHYYTCNDLPLCLASAASYASWILVNMNFHIVCRWKVSVGGFRPHRNKTVTKCSIICKCERLVTV
jgi:hypothetical protein